MTLPSGLPLFDAVASADARDRGQNIARDSLPGWNRGLMEAAREVARMIAQRKGTVNADDVVEHFADCDVDLTAKLGNAMGSLFRGPAWEFTGKYVKSARVHAHANLLRVWRLRTGK